MSGKKEARLANSPRNLSHAKVLPGQEVEPSLSKLRLTLLRDRNGGVASSLQATPPGAGCECGAVLRVTRQTLTFFSDSQTQ